MNTCENCGLPEWAVTSGGESIKVTAKAENRFKRDSTKTVWTCSRECGVQMLAISKYGPASHKWPIALSQFRAMEKRPAVTKMPVKTTDSKDSSEGLFSESISEHDSAFFVTKKGRPRKTNPLTGAERVRAYRVRKTDKHA